MITPDYVVKLAPTSYFVIESLIMHIGFRVV